MNQFLYHKHVSKEGNMAIQKLTYTCILSIQFISLIVTTTKITALSISTHLVTIISIFIKTFINN